MEEMWIRLRGIPVHAHHGVYKHEQEQGTDFEIDAELLIDASMAIRSDALIETLDYSKLHDEAISFSQDNRFNLLEKWAHDLALHLMNNHRLAIECIVRLRKPGIAVKGSLEWIEVEYHHRKTE